MSEQRRTVRDKAALALILAALLAQSLILADDSDARQPLKGTASFNEKPLGTPYAPKNRTVQRADILAKNFQLNAAEILYKQCLKSDPRNAGAWNGLGKVAWFRTTSSNQNLRDQSDNLLEKAIQNFLTALRYQPGYVEAHVNLASVYMEQGRMADADEQIERALGYNPSSPLALEKKGEWLVRNREYDEGLPYLKKAIRLNSADASAHYYLGVAYAARNELDAAHQALMMAQSLDPSSAPVHLQLALIYEKQGNGSAAIEQYQQALALKPELVKARLKLADYLEKRGDMSGALEHLKTAMETEPPSWELTNRIGKLAVQNNQPTVAVKYYRKWLNEHPDDPKAREGLTYAKTKLSKYKKQDDDLISQGEAKRYAEQAMKYQPNNFEARLISAKLDREMGKTLPSQTGKDPHMVDVALSQPAFEPYQAFEKGQLLMSRYQFAAADAAFENARTSAMDNRSQMTFGELFLTKGLPSLAEESFRQVLRKLPDNASAQLGLSKAQEARHKASELITEARQNHRKNSLDMAISQANEALQYDFKNADAHYLLGQLYEKQKSYAQAADHYYAYVNLSPMSEDTERVKRHIASLKEKMAKKGPGTGAV